MSKLTSINLGKLYVNELGALAGFTLEKLAPLATKGLIPVKLVDGFKSAVDVHKVSIGSDANPEATKKFHELDGYTDESIKALKSAAITASNRRQESVRNAGMSILNAIRKRDYELQNLPIPDEISRVELLVADIRDSESLSEAITLIGADADLDQLENDNKATKAFWSGMQAPKSENERSSVEATRALRVELGKVFKYLSSTAEFEPGIAAAMLELNEIIDQYAVRLKTRATISENEKNEEKAQR